MSRLEQVLCPIDYWESSPAVYFPLLNEVTKPRKFAKIAKPPLVNPRVFI